jgi:hypothetical protein
VPSAPGRPPSASGRLCHGDGAQGRGDGHPEGVIVAYTPTSEMLSNRALQRSASSRYLLLGL